MPRLRAKSFSPNQASRGYLRIVDTALKTLASELLEKHKLGRKLFKEVHKWLSDLGIYFKEGTIVDATIIEAASSTKNKAKSRDPEMHQPRKEINGSLG